MVFFHPCPINRRARRWVPPDLEGTTLEEMWLRIFGGFAGGTPTPPTAEQAIEETARQRHDPRIEETDR